MKRAYYLQSVSEEEALKVIDNLFEKHYTKRTETISVYDAINRVVSNSVFANVSSPAYNASAMDGVATVSKLTSHASETNPVIIKKEDYQVVNTGNMISKKFDTVMMIEDVEYIKEGIKIYKSHSYFEHIRPIGEDIVKGELVIPKYTKITPIILSALLSAGVTNVTVLSKPKVAIIPTGDEIVSASDQIKRGQIIDSNSYFMKYELEALGALVTLYDVQKDVYHELEKTVLDATKEFDFVIVGAGSSAGTKDYTYQVIKQNGRLHVHGISVKPGKPSIIGEVNQKIVFGIPGYPVSTYVSFQLLVKHIMNLFTHQNQVKQPPIKAKLTKKVYSSLKNKEYVRMQLGSINGELVATPLSRGAGISMSLVKNDGFLIVERNHEGYERNEVVDIYPTKAVETTKTLLSTGSHDIILDLINDMMHDSGYSLKSTHVGSFGGVMAAKNRESHISPVHILDTDMTYNKNVIASYLDSEYQLVEGVKRIQGLYVKKGNPKQIKSIKDLSRRVSFVNRQRGSGTRILFDYLLSQHKILPNEVKGYDYELSTHTQVAATVLDPRYDVGLGIQSVSKRYDLDFIELAHESYDFIVHQDTIHSEVFQQFIRILQSDEFAQKLNDLSGYKLVNPGKVIL